MINDSYAGIATHYLHSSSLPDLEARLGELKFEDSTEPTRRLEIVNATIEEFVQTLPHDSPIQLAGDIRAAIDRCFKFNSIQEILDALKAEKTEWADKTLKTLDGRSPTSLHVTLRQMRLGKNWDLAETFQREHHIASKFMEHPDFTEGVSAKLIEKPARDPKWSPATLNEVSKDDVEAFFKVEGTDRLQLLNEKGKFKDYPHAIYGLPRESEVVHELQQGNQTKEQVLKYWLKERKGKVGVKEVVEEMLERRTTADASTGILKLKG
jgi:3-hydroxyisobutyryl-CoA hydrolase